MHITEGKTLFNYCTYVQTMNFEWNCLQVMPVHTTASRARPLVPRHVTAVD